MTMEHDPVERAIDRAAHQLSTGDPSAGFVTEVLNRIDQSELVPEARWLFWSPWRLATAGAVALAVILLLLLSRQTVRQPLPVEPSRVASADIAAESRRAENVPSADDVSEPTAAVTPTPTPRISVSRRRESEPFPVVPPIEIESITLDPIEMAGIDVALLEISPIRIDPVGITRQETP